MTRSYLGTELQENAVHRGPNFKHSVRDIHHEQSAFTIDPGYIPTLHLLTIQYNYLNKVFLHFWVFIKWNYGYFIIYTYIPSIENNE
jgi:hypothetical protein